MLIWHNQLKALDDAPPNSLMDSTACPKVKTMEGKGVGTRYLARNISGVEGRARARTNDKWVNYSHESAQTKQQVG